MKYLKLFESKYRNGNFKINQDIYGVYEDKYIVKINSISSKKGAPSRYSWYTYCYVDVLSPNRMLNSKNLEINIRKIKFDEENAIKINHVMEYMENKLKVN